MTKPEQSKAQCTAHLDIDLVTAEDNGNRLADSLEITMPVGNVFVRDFGSNIEHDDTTLTLSDLAHVSVSWLGHRYGGRKRIEHT